MKILLVILISTSFQIYNKVNAETEVRKVTVFTELNLQIPATVYIHKGNESKVEIEAKQSVLDEIITKVNGRTLLIRFPGKNYLSRNYDPGKIIIHITSPDVNKLSLTGSGDIIAGEKLTTPILDLYVSGSGKIILEEPEVERVKVNISGSGDVIIKKGKQATEFTGVITGSGNIKAGDFEVQDVKITIAGSGNCMIHANVHIAAKIFGSGNVIYKGNPSLDTTISGSGKVKEAQ